jgi:hypothetical protein
MFGALVVVGVVSHGVVRHLVQTAPLWVAVVLGLRGRELAKWCAMPCFSLWLAIMVFIWLYLLGWARIVSGTFSPTEIAMTLVVGAAAVAGLGVAIRWRTSSRSTTALAAFALFSCLQLIAFRISFLPGIAHD